MTNNPEKRIILIDGHNLSLEEVEIAAKGPCRVELTDSAVKSVSMARRQVESILSQNITAYGINTGFGNLAEVRIPPSDLSKLQLNLIRSHACGVGNPLPPHEVRALMLLRANVMARGHSGITEKTLQLLLSMIERNVLPAIPEKGSVGASGDLAPLAHLAMTLIGEGKCLHKNGFIDSAQALTEAGLRPVDLQAKEGLALVNGTQAMSAIGALSLLRAERLSLHADMAGALSLDALLGSTAPFDERIHRLRPHPAQIRTAENFRKLLADSSINESHRNCSKVQDPYSLRCIPQVHGAAKDGMLFCRNILEREINSATDNPLLFPEDDEVISGGNFHGQYPALALDVLAIATSSLGCISERRIEQLVNPTLSGLPPFLAANPGLDSGFMIAQVTAAALVNENKVLCHPASSDSIPSSAGREDHVSMGMTSALKCRTVVENVRTILAIEFMCAAQALEHRLPMRTGKGLEPVYELIRKSVPPLSGDRCFKDDIEAICSMIDSEILLDAALKKVQIS